MIARSSERNAASRERQQHACECSSGRAEGEEVRARQRKGVWHGARDGGGEEGSRNRQGMHGTVAGESAFVSLSAHLALPSEPYIYPPPSPSSLLHPRPPSARLPPHPARRVRDDAWCTPLRLRPYPRPTLIRASCASRLPPPPSPLRAPALHPRNTPLTTRRHAMLYSDTPDLELALDPTDGRYALTLTRTSPSYSISCGRGEPYRAPRCPSTSVLASLSSQSSSSPSMEGRSYLKYPIPDMHEAQPGVLATGQWTMHHPFVDAYLTALARLAPKQRPLQGPRVSVPNTATTSPILPSYDLDARASPLSLATLTSTPQSEVERIRWRAQHGGIASALTVAQVITVQYELFPGPGSAWYAAQVPRLTEEQKRAVFALAALRVLNHPTHPAHWALWAKNVLHRTAGVVHKVFRAYSHALLYLLICVRGSTMLTHSYSTQAVSHRLPRRVDRPPRKRMGSTGPPLGVRSPAATARETQGGRHDPAQAQSRCCLVVQLTAERGGGDSREPAQASADDARPSRGRTPGLELDALGYRTPRSGFGRRGRRLEAGVDRCRWRKSGATAARARAARYRHSAISIPSGHIYLHVDVHVELEICRIDVTKCHASVEPRAAQTCAGPGHSVYTLGVNATVGAVYSLYVSGAP